MPPAFIECFSARSAAAETAADDIRGCDDGLLPLLPDVLRGGPMLEGATPPPITRWLFATLFGFTALPLATTARAGGAEKVAAWLLLLASAAVGEILSHHDFFSCCVGSVPAAWPDGGGCANAS